jgi:hypothetical protein
MAFHIRISMSHVDPKASKSVLALGDTVLVTEKGPVLLTGKISRAYAEISY